MKKSFGKSEELSSSSIVAVAKDQVSSDLDGEVVILNLASGVYYGLEEVGTRIWSLIQKPITVDEIKDIIADEYDVEPERCEKDLIVLLQKLLEEKLIEVKSNR